nr:MAG: ORF1 [Torque teno midi virus]
MPGYWRRRRKTWWGRKPWYKRKRRGRFRYTKQRRRRPTRRATRRRRRRRRYKVRRKRKTITIKQWQPDSIVNCKIKGLSVLVLGGQGKQLVCYTSVKQAWTPAKAPGGGGFGCELFSLSSLYDDYKFRKNIWTKTNITKDLCRYLRCKFTFYRHRETDFIINYHRQPPFDLTKEAYTNCHPLRMLLAKHKIILPSAATNPKGKLKKTKKILPPKQMISKWFFQEHFCIEPLVQINAAACNLTYNNLGCCNVNQITTFFYLNTAFWRQPNWDNASVIYKPYPTVPNDLYFWSKAEWEKNPGTPFQFSLKDVTTQNQLQLTKGWFQKEVLQAFEVTKTNCKQTLLGTIPVNVCRYNPNIDSGEKNKIWLVSTYQTDWRKPIDKILIYEGLPLYMMLFGYLSFVQGMKKTKDFFLNYVLAIESPALQPAAQVGAEGPIVPIDQTFRDGYGPYREPIPYSWQTHWVPNIYSQIEVLNGIVEAGPLVPKYGRTTNSTWELDAFYTFYFKWGGPETTEPAVTDPHLQAVYEVPDHLTTTLQIRDPAKQTPASLLHPWDIRHGYFTKTALKRMSSNISTDSDFQPDAEGYLPKKRKKTGPELRVPDEETEEIQACLQALFKEDTYQETQEEDLLKLIKQQQQKQQELKYNILRLLSELKQQQNLLKLQTGFVN